MSVPLYVAETWAVMQKEMRKLKSFHMRCIRDILGFTLWHKRGNEEPLKEKDEQAIEEQMKELGLTWFWLLQRMPNHLPQKQLLEV